MTSLFGFTQACPQAASGAGQVQAPLAQVWVEPQGVAHWPTLPPSPVFPPIAAPPLPPRLVPLPLLAGCGVAWLEEQLTLSAVLASATEMAKTRRTQRATCRICGNSSTQGTPEQGRGFFLPRRNDAHARSSIRFIEPPVLRSDFSQDQRNPNTTTEAARGWAATPQPPCRKLPSRRQVPPHATPQPTRQVAAHVTRRAASVLLTPCEALRDNREAGRRGVSGSFLLFEPNGTTRRLHRRRPNFSCSNLEGNIF